MASFYKNKKINKSSKIVFEFGFSLPSRFPAPFFSAGRRRSRNSYLPSFLGLGLGLGFPFVLPFLPSTVTHTRARALTFSLSLSLSHTHTHTHTHPDPDRFIWLPFKLRHATDPVFREIFRRHVRIQVRPPEILPFSTWHFLHLYARVLHFLGIIWHIDDVYEYMYALPELFLLPISVSSWFVLSNFSYLFSYNRRRMRIKACFS